MDDFYDDARKQNALYWGLRVFHTYPDLFAYWCCVDATNMPWALGLFDEDLSRTLSIYGRHGALITSPIVTLTDLPPCRADFRDAKWPKDLCLTVEHYSGMDLTFHHYADGSGCVHLGVRDGCDGESVTLCVAAAVITEYLTCTTVDPTRWHERPGWVRNPRPYNAFEASPRHYEATGDLDLAWDRADKDRWFATVQDERTRRWLAAL
jgi:hypothetical protein